MLKDLRGREASRFALQWHITNACELSCTHCYDRSRVAPLELSRGVALLDDLARFSEARGVASSVSFTGGNPFLHPDFFDLYAEAVARGFGVSVLGNPVPPADLERLVAIRKPGYFQISLEGLEPRNDAIRGAGTYRHAIEFLRVLRGLGIESHVMVTVHKANVRDVIPLGERLKGVADFVTWNRLSLVGEGASLEPLSREELVRFMNDWIIARIYNRHFKFKDNLFNIARHQLALPLSGGCAGFGCGAAFNFLAILPNGDAHACRKFPSPLGSALEQGLAAVWDSPAAAAYRAGSAACETCELHASCGGCMATTFGTGQDPLTVRDPMCFWEQRDEHFPNARSFEIAPEERDRILNEHRRG